MQKFRYPYHIISSCFGMQHTMELIPETAVNVTFFTSMFFEELEDEEGEKQAKLNEEARCYTKIHFDYNLRKD